MLTPAAVQSHDGAWGHAGSHGRDRAGQCRHTELTADERAEPEALRAEKRQSEEDYEILRRAIAFFGKEVR